MCYWFVSNRFLTVTQFVRVWRNECLRIFHDRLIDETDKALVITNNMVVFVDSPLCGLQ